MNLGGLLNNILKKKKKDSFAKFKLSYIKKSLDKPQRDSASRRS